MSDSGVLAAYEVVRHLVSSPELVVQLALVDLPAPHANLNRVDVHNVPSPFPPSFEPLLLAFLADLKTAPPIAPTLCALHPPLTPVPPRRPIRARPQPSQHRIQLGHRLGPIQPPLVRVEVDLDSELCVHGFEEFLVAPGPAVEEEASVGRVPLGEAEEVGDGVLLGQELGRREDRGSVEVDARQAAEGVGSAGLDHVGGEGFVVREVGDVAGLGADVGGDKDRERRRGGDRLDQEPARSGEGQRQVSGQVPKGWLGRLRVLTWPTLDTG